MPEKTLQKSLFFPINQPFNPWDVIFSFKLHRDWIQRLILHKNILLEPKMMNYILCNNLEWLKYPTNMPGKDDFHEVLRGFGHLNDQILICAWQIRILRPIDSWKHGFEKFLSRKSVLIQKLFKNVVLNSRLLEFFIYPTHFLPYKSSESFILFMS